MTAGNSLCFIIAFRILEISIILKLNEEKNISPPFYRFLKYFVLLYKTKYFKQMRKDNVTLLKIKWL